MKNFIAKLLITFALVLTSVNICSANDVNCEDSSNRVEQAHSKSASAEKSSTDTDSHHCLCSMVCHNLYISFPTYTTSSPVIVISEAPHVFKPAIYPQIILSLDKPPII